MNFSTLFTDFFVFHSITSGTTHCLFPITPLSETDPSTRHTYAYIHFTQLDSKKAEAEFIVEDLNLISFMWIRLNGNISDAEDGSKEQTFILSLSAQ